MQQTEKYKLNLIEKTDTFSPDPLNENMQRVEAAIAAGDAALDQRVTALEVKKIVFGSYKPVPTKNGEPMTIDLGFTPVAVLAMPSDITQSSTALCVGDRIVRKNNQGIQMKIVENGFYVAGDMTSTYYICYNYVAFG